MLRADIKTFDILTLTRTSAVHTALIKGVSIKGAIDREYMGSFCVNKYG